ncbi:hypothetical protein GCM10025881_23950 [Pseudolysinimonas kribbensis]|uniref:HAD family hydrolase n=1 Tax=Pseudolysinimonas kribbensis TaxID=433641 RepID=A0ABQ6KA54_9MICO|nr:HAD family hydrolase [Pseudolysinimonas kribbensis]GMA95571.1 hypothetical protein GCM10025881_23950 [Pseudolysinimonas kribbensis]
MALRAILFDVDGTLVDSTYLHVDAWQRACAAVGRPVDAWRVHRAIGMDSGGLVDDLLGDAAGELGDAAKDEHARLFAGMRERLRPLPGAVELLGALRERRLTVVLATSAPEDELAMLRDALGLAEGEVPETNADDVDVAKPHPGIVQVALERAGAAADEAVLVGDATWDMIAAGRAGSPRSECGAVGSVPTSSRRRAPPRWSTIRRSCCGAGGPDIRRHPDVDAPRAGIPHRGARRRDRTGEVSTARRLCPTGGGRCPCRAPPQPNVMRRSRLHHDPSRARAPGGVRLRRWLPAERYPAGYGEAASSRARCAALRVAVAIVEATASGVSGRSL